MSVAMAEENRTFTTVSEIGEGGRAALHDSATKLMGANTERGAALARAPERDGADPRLLLRQ